jgi:cellobiose phosphorylase
MVGSVEGILGMRPDLKGLRISPSIPPEWDGFEISKKFRGKQLHITVENPQHRQCGCTRLTVNGKEMPDNYVPADVLADHNEIVLVM